MNVRNCEKSEPYDEFQLRFVIYIIMSWFVTPPGYNYVHTSLKRACSYNCNDIICQWWKLKKESYGWEDR